MRRSSAPPALLKLEVRKIMRRGAVAVILEDQRFLVIRRAPAISAGGKVCFPGGGIEAGETEEAALVRELQEELSAAVRPLRRIWRSVTPWNVHLAWWLAERCDERPFAPHPDEVSECFWLTAADLAAHPDLLYSNGEFLQAVARGDIHLGAEAPDFA
jgi:mutator protein MutT